MVIVLRSLALLATVGASFALFIEELFGPWLTAFIDLNRLSLPNRQRVLVGMAAGAAGAVFLGCMVWWRDAGRLRRLAHRAAPGILLGFVPPFCVPAAWSNPLFVGVLGTGFVLLAERLFRMALAVEIETPGGLGSPSAVPDRWDRLAAALRRFSSDVRTGLLSEPVRRFGPAVVVGAAVLGYAIYMSVFTLYMHGRFQTFGYDLGQYDNTFWTTLHGHPLRCAPLGLNKNWSELRDHAVLSVFFFLPFYAIAPGAPTLLVIQSTVLALGAIPLYRFASRRLPRWQAAIVAVAYLLFPPMHEMQFYDFHFQPVAATFVLLVIDFVDERRYWLCAAAFFIAVGCREDVSVGLAILGAFLALSGHRFRAGLVMAAGSAVYFVLLRFIIMPSFGSWGFQNLYKELMPVGAPSFGGVIETMVSNPVFTLRSLLDANKLRYLIQILLPVAFLPLRRSYLVASIIPGSMFTILTSPTEPMIDTGFQYSAHFMPYVFPAAVLAIASYGHDPLGVVKRRSALIALMLGTILCGIFWGAIPPRFRVHGGYNMLPMTKPTAANRQKHRDLVELDAMIPPDASVAMSEAEMPHVSHIEMRSLKDTTDADYLLYGIDGGYQGATNAERALAAGEFEKVAERPGLMLLKRKTHHP